MFADIIHPTVMVKREKVKHQIRRGKKKVEAVGCCHRKGEIARDLASLPLQCPHLLNIEPRLKREMDSMSKAEVNGRSLL